MRTVVKISRPPLTVRYSGTLKRLGGIAAIAAVAQLIAFLAGGGM